MAYSKKKKKRPENATVSTLPGRLRKSDSNYVKGENLQGIFLHCGLSKKLGIREIRKKAIELVSDLPRKRVSMEDGRPKPVSGDK